MNFTNNTKASSKALENLGMLDQRILKAVRLLSSIIDNIFLK